MYPLNFPRRATILGEDRRYPPTIMLDANNEVANFFENPNIVEMKIILLPYRLIELLSKVNQPIAQFSIEQIA
jgi:hypothetical protein